MERLARCAIWGVIAGVIIALGMVVLIGAYHPPPR